VGEILLDFARGGQRWLGGKERILTSSNRVMHPKELFEANLSLVERVIDRVCSRAHLVGADREDFASIARIHLIDNDYEVLRQHDGSCSLAGYLAVVLQRLLCDERNRTMGRWRASAEAKRMGEAGVLLETLLLRDHRALQEVVPLVTAADRRLSPRDVESMAARLPERMPRSRPSTIDPVLEATLVANDDAASRAIDSDRQRLAEQTGGVLRETMASFTGEERMIIKLRFGSAMSIADVARILQLPPRPLYRQIELLLERLRQALGAAGIDAASAAELIGSTELDLGIADGKNDSARQSDQQKDTNRRPT
jgi:RNA polymerase sigma factor (sigma-70 family)